MTIPQSYRFLNNQVDLFIKSRMNPGTSPSQTDESGGGASASDINGYKSQISQCKSDISVEITKLDSSIRELENIGEPQRDNFSSDEDYNDAVADYKSKKEQLADLKRQREELKAELDKCDEILAQLETLTGQEISQSLKDEVKAALQANEARKITALENYISLNEEAMILIQSFKQQQQKLAEEAGVINDKIQTLQGVPEPNFANYINRTDGTVDVQGYMAAVKEYKDAQEEILEKSKELEELKKKSDKIDSILQDLASAETLEDFQAKVNEYKGYNFDDISAEDVEIRTLDVVNEDIEKVQEQIKAKAEEKETVTEQISTLNTQLTDLLSAYYGALENDAPKLADYVDGEGFPDVKAYNQAVKDYNKEQEERLQEIESIIKDLTDYEKQNEKLDQEIKELNEELDKLAEEAKAKEDEGTGTRAGSRGGGEDATGDGVNATEGTQTVSTNSPGQNNGKWSFVYIKASDYLAAGAPAVPGFTQLSIYSQDGLRIDDHSSNVLDAEFAGHCIGDMNVLREKAAAGEYIYINLPYNVIQGELLKALQADENAAVYPDEEGKWVTVYDPSDGLPRHIISPGEPDREFVKNGGYTGPEYTPPASNGGGGSTGSLGSNAGTRGGNTGDSGSTSGTSSTSTAGSRGASSSGSNMYDNKWGYVKIKASALRAAGFKNPVTLPDGRTFFVGIYRASDGMKIDDGLDGRRNAADRNTTEGDDARLEAMGDEYVYINLPYSYLVGDLLEAINSDENAGVFVDDNEHVPYIEKDGQTFLDLGKVGPNDTDIVDGGYTKGAVSQSGGVESTQSTSNTSTSTKNKTGGAFIRIRADILLAALKALGISPEGRSFYSDYNPNVPNSGNRIDTDQDNRTLNDTQRLQAEGSNYVYFNIDYSEIRGGILEALQNDYPNTATYSEQYFKDNATTWNASDGRPRHITANVKNLIPDEL